MGGVLGGGVHREWGIEAGQSPSGLGGVLGSGVSGQGPSRLIECARGVLAAAVLSAAVARGARGRRSRARFPPTHPQYCNPRIYNYNTEASMHAMCVCVRENIIWPGARARDGR